MALRIVRATADASTQRPLRLWHAGRHQEALDRIAGPAGAEHAAEVPQLLELALAADPRHAVTVGEALASWDDDTAAYRIVKAAVEQALERTNEQGVEAWVPTGLAALQLVLPVLHVRPAEPVLLNYLGVVLYGLNEPALALSVLTAARRLDPTLEHVAGSIRAARERTRKPVRMRVLPVHAAILRALRGPVRAVAARAVAPRPHGRISFCMIVRDEEEMLPDCLASVQAGVDELIVVDTGSVDRTVEIAESFGATVLHFAWNGSFADARNHGLEAATGDHILWLDADERLEPGDAERLHDLAAQSWREGHWLVETNFTGQEEVGHAATHLALRLFRNRPAYRFTGTIHEQIRNKMPVDLSERFAVSHLQIRHYGYLKSRIDAKDKHRRNLDLLQAELRTSPGNAFTHFNIGTEYVVIGDWPLARHHLEQSYALLREQLDWWGLAYAPLLVVRLVGVRRSSGDLAGAAALAAEQLRAVPDFTDLVFERGLVALLEHRYADAEAWFRRCLDLGDAPASLGGIVGQGSFQALSALAQVAKAVGDDEAATAWLRRSLEEHPSFLAPALELTDLLLAAPDADPDAVLASLEAYGHDELTWFLFLGTAFYERGHAAHAEALFRRTLERSPAHPAATVGLAEALLTQHRYADVGASTRPLGAGTPAATALTRCRLLAGVLAADPAAAEAAAARLAESGSSDEAAFARAFVALHLHDRPAAPLPGGAALHAMTMLDALARLEEFDAFGRTVSLAHAAFGNPRVAELALGELYLARGYYRMAGDAALRAVELGGPDARALALLGKAGVAEGMFEDALDVLEQSLRLDPGQPSVQTLVDELRRRTAA